MDTILGNGEFKYDAADDGAVVDNATSPVEVAMPIYDPDIYHELRSIIELQLQDNTKARLLFADQSNPYRSRKPEDKAVRAQLDTYHLLARKVNPVDV